MYLGVGVVVHICNHSYSGGDRGSQFEARWNKVKAIPYLKNKLKAKGPGT
jgi:hypothetical protein